MAATQKRPDPRRVYVGNQFAHLTSQALMQNTQNTQLHATGAGRLVRNKLYFVASVENAGAIAA